MMVTLAFLSQSTSTTSVRRTVPGYMVDLALERGTVQRERYRYSCTFIPLYYTKFSSMIVLVCILLYGTYTHTNLVDLDYSCTAVQLLYR